VVLVPAAPIVPVPSTLAIGVAVGWATGSKLAVKSVETSEGSTLGFDQPVLSANAESSFRIEPLGPTRGAEPPVAAEPQIALLLISIAEA